MSEFDNDMEKALKGQIPEYTEANTQSPQESADAPRQEIGSMIGKKINVGSSMQRIDKEEIAKLSEDNNLSRVGESIKVNADIRDGWMEVDKTLLGERATFYKRSWEFRIRPATVEAIRNWSTIDDENASSVGRVFNEVLKSCLSIQTPNGPIPWYNLNAWDRFFFILLIREYTFINGDTAITYVEDCPNCDNSIEFRLDSQSLMFDMPDPEVMPMYDQESSTWLIDCREYGLDIDPITLYLPTLEKEVNITQWAINRYQENPNKQIDQVMIKFLPWFVPKISKDDVIAQRQIKEFKMKFESWDSDTFTFMNDVITNVIVTPSTRLVKKCPTCGEEVTSQIRFPNGASALFNVQSKFKKFGKK